MYSTFLQHLHSNGCEHLAGSGCRSYFGNRHVEIGKWNGNQGNWNGWLQDKILVEDIGNSEYRHIQHNKISSYLLHQSSVLMLQTTYNTIPFCFFVEEGTFFITADFSSMLDNGVFFWTLHSLLEWRINLEGDKPPRFDLATYLQWFKKMFDMIQIDLWTHWKKTSPVVGGRSLAPPVIGFLWIWYPPANFSPSGGGSRGTATLWRLPRESVRVLVNSRSVSGSAF